MSWRWSFFGKFVTTSTIRQYNVLLLINMLMFIKLMSWWRIWWHRQQYCIEQCMNRALVTRRLSVQKTRYSFLCSQAKSKLHCHFWRTVGRGTQSNCRLNCLLLLLLFVSYSSKYQNSFRFFGCRKTRCAKDNRKPKCSVQIFE